MKTINTIIIAALGSVALLSSCNWVLEEHPKTRYTPDFFTTPAGVEGGLTALYALCQPAIRERQCLYL